MSCNCTPLVVKSRKVCEDDCLIVKDIMYNCDDGPAPCGDSLELDLSEYNDVSASECGATYSIRRFDSEGFDSVSITPEGVLTAVSSDNYKRSDDYVIEYKVTTGSCSVLSATGFIYVCMKNPCPQECGSNCNPCTGGCMTVNNQEVKMNGGGCDRPFEFDLGAASHDYSACDDSIVYRVKSYSRYFKDVAVDGSGVVTANLDKDVLLNKYQKITVEVSCTTSKYMVYDSIIKVMVEDPCTDLNCSSSQECDRCNEECKNKGVDLQLGSPSVGFID